MDVQVAEKQKAKLEKARKRAAEKDEALAVRERELETMKAARAAAEAALDEASRGGSEKDAALARRVI